MYQQFSTSKLQQQPYSQQPSTNQGFDGLLQQTASGGSGGSGASSSLQPQLHQSYQAQQQSQMSYQQPQQQSMRPDHHRNISGQRPTSSAAQPIGSGLSGSTPQYQPTGQTGAGSNVGMTGTNQQYQQTGQPSGGNNQQYQQKINSFVGQPMQPTGWYHICLSKCHCCSLPVSIS